MKEYKLGEILSKEACGLCQHDPACGFAAHNGVRYCHEDDHSCYMEAQ